MERKEITQKLTESLHYHINPKRDTRIYIASEVTFDYTTNPIRVDVMRFKPLNTSTSGIEKGDFYCYEIKSCKADFKSKNGHNFLGYFNYYVMPSELFKDKEIKKLIPYGIGVYGYKEDVIGKDKIVSLKKAKRLDRNRPASEMILMMYRSNQRELLKGGK